MGQQYLIDSNAVIDYLSGKIPEKGMPFMNQVINDIPNISVISKIEFFRLSMPLKNKESLNL